MTTNQNDIVKTGEHVKQAIEEKNIGSNKYEEHLQEMVADGKLMIDTKDKKIGQVNGLAVMAVGEHMFGKPSRITANTYMGKSGIVNIERENEDERYKSYQRCVDFKWLYRTKICAEISFGTYRKFNL